MILSKISIGHFLLRITVQKLHRWIIYTVMALTVLTGLIFFFVTMLQCLPVSYFWDKDQPGQCVNIEVVIALTYLYSVFSVICDFTFALLPIVLILQLQMSRSMKISLIPILLMACVYVSLINRCLTKLTCVHPIERALLSWYASYTSRTSAKQTSYV